MARRLPHRWCARDAGHAQESGSSTEFSSCNAQPVYIKTSLPALDRLGLVACCTRCLASLVAMLALAWTVMSVRIPAGQKAYLRDQQCHQVQAGLHQKVQVPWAQCWRGTPA